MQDLLSSLPEMQTPPPEEPSKGLIGQTPTILEQTPPQDDLTLPVDTLTPPPEAPSPSEEVADGELAKTKSSGKQTLFSLKSQETHNVYLYEPSI